MVYDTTIEYSAYFTQSRLAPGERGTVFALTAAVLLAVTFFPVVKSLKSIIIRLSVPGNDKLWGCLCVISFSFVFMNLLFTYPPPPTPSVRVLLSRYLMLSGIIALYFATTRAVEAMSDAVQAKSELDLIRRRVVLQKNYNDRLVSQIDDVRRMRHDLRHHHAALSALSKSGNADAIKKYLDSVPSFEDSVPFTGNLAADSMLLYYTDMAKKLGVQVDNTVSSLCDLPLPDSDMCVILGNLLENAIDAQMYLDESKRYIRITASCDTHTFILAVDNRFDGTLNMSQNGEYLSRKSGEGHGIGISSVNAICKKYGGMLRIEVQNDMFMAGVVIGL